jgi:type I restriction enzyme S subunit
MTFREFQLQDILDIQWGDTKTTKASYVSEGHVAYSASGPDGFLEKFDYDREGIVLSAIGANCGSTFYATGKWSCIKNTIRIFPKTEEIDLKFFYYMTKSPHFWPRRGSAQPFISQTDIRETAVKIPDIAIQRVIGQILQELEMTIEANKQLSKTLEDTAQTIFKSWFIDFDPVKAKMAREKPVGMDDATAALFPDSMEDSELGLIPRGWSIANLNKIASQRKENVQVGMISENDAYVGLDSIPRKALFFNEWKSASKVQSNKSKFFENDILFGKLRPYFHKVAVAPVDGICSTDIVVIKVDELLNLPFVANFVNEISFIAFLSNRASGTRMPRTSWGEMCEPKFACPPDAIIQSFGQLTLSAFHEASALQKQNRVLAEIRDELLPRLISGKLKIPENMLTS